MQFVLGTGTLRMPPKGTNKQPKPRTTEYSPSQAKAYRFCQKKFYFSWLTRRKQGWRKLPEHPWNQVYRLKQVKHKQVWAGDLYHQLISNALNKAKLRNQLSLKDIQRDARKLAAEQFRFSEERRFLSTAKSKAGNEQGDSYFLALFEHAYDLPAEGILVETQDKVCVWLESTLAWDGWETLISRIREAEQVHIEPQYLNYMIGGARISARMDVGLETRSGRFYLYDWKCYSENERFHEYNQDMFRHQLLAYALWPMRRDIDPLPLGNVTACIYNPIANESTEISFLEEECADFELEVAQWAGIHERLFTEVADIEFDDLEGPYDPQRSCPLCPYKAVCGKEIIWHQLS